MHTLPVGLHQQRSCGICEMQKRVTPLKGRKQNFAQAKPQTCEERARFVWFAGSKIADWTFRVAERCMRQMCVHFLAAIKRTVLGRLADKTGLLKITFWGLGFGGNPKKGIGCWQHFMVASRPFSAPPEQSLCACSTSDIMGCFEKTLPLS